MFDTNSAQHSGSEHTRSAACAILAHDLLSEITRSPEGGTLHARGQWMGGRTHTITTGYYVGGMAPALSAPSADCHTIAAWLYEIGVERRAPEYVGWWVDTETGVTHLDSVAHADTLALALVLGASAGELAVWDIAAGAEIRI